LKPSDLPVQRPENLGQVKQTRREFQNTINYVMRLIANDAYHARQDLDKYKKLIMDAHERFFRSMKGATNIQKTDAYEFVKAEVGHQKVLYRSLEKLGSFFDSVNPLEPVELYAYPYWDHGPSTGINVEINDTRFYALPKVPCSTDQYLTLKQDPVPATIVLINSEMILMLPYRENPSSKTRKQLNELLRLSGEVNEEGVPSSIHVKRNYLSTHSKEKIDERVIYRLIEKNRVDAFMVGYPDKNIALIYTGLENKMDRLWKTIYFDWNGMWRRY